MKSTHIPRAWLRITMTLAVLLLPAIATAGTVTVNEEQGKLAIETVDTSVDEILSQIAQSQEFQIVRMGPAPEEKLSGQFSGTVNEVMARILQNENHLIVHSAKAKTGIARVVLFGPPSKSEIMQATAVPAAIAPGRRLNASSPQPLPREVIPPANAQGQPQQPLTRRPRS
jgi:hypothetical protein